MRVLMIPDMTIRLNKDKGFNFIGTFTEALTYPEFFKYVDKWISDKSERSHHIAIINAYCATVAFQNHRVRNIYCKADLIAPDGRPFVYWLRWILKKSCEQFDASSIVMNLAEKSKETGYSFYLYGGHPDVVVKMKSKLEEMYPHINIVGYYSPPFRPLTEDEEQAICDELNTLKPDIICVGLGTPKQDYWIDEHIYKIKGSVFIPCGAIFDFFGGRIKRAPVFVQKSGFEWLYRLFSKDFKRLFKRYTYMNIVFLWNFFLQLTRIKSRNPVRMLRK
jgi:N-acetylglucosaminyldiphosphoundecaprenol N-acetyl-beta-D-mannosaminyltransferase